MDIETIKKNFDEIRKAKGLKIEEICTTLGGITRQALYNYLKVGISLATLNKLALALGVETYELLKPQEEKTKNEMYLVCPHCHKPIVVKFGIQDNQKQNN